MIHFVPAKSHLLSSCFWLLTAEIARWKEIGDRLVLFLFKFSFLFEQRHVVDYFCTFPCRCPPHISSSQCRWSGTFSVSFHEKATIKTSFFSANQQRSPHAIKCSNQMKIEAARKYVKIIYCSDMFHRSGRWIHWTFKVPQKFVYLPFLAASGGLPIQQIDNFSLSRDMSEHIILIFTQ